MSTEQKAKRKRQYLFEMFEQEWTCPISSVAIVDPVVTSDGHTYERCQITKWFKKEKTSPKTGLKLQNLKILPNITLKSVIQKFDKQIKYQIQKIIKENKQHTQKIQQLQEQVKGLNQKLSKQFQSNKNLMDTIEKHEKKQQAKRDRLLQLKELNKTTSERKTQIPASDNKQESDSDFSSGSQIVDGQQYKLRSLRDNILIQLQDYDIRKSTKQKCKRSLSNNSSPLKIEKSQKVQANKKDDLNDLIQFKDYLLRNPVLYDEKLKILDHSNQKINFAEFFRYDWPQLKQLNLEDTDINDQGFELLAEGIHKLKSLEKLNVAENDIVCVKKSTMEKLAKLQRIQFAKLNKGKKRSITQLDYQTELMLGAFSLSNRKVSVIY